MIDDNEDIQKSKLVWEQVINALRPIPSQTSPTDIASRGLYKYQEPEQDEQGTFYGYKVLHWDFQYNCFVSPRYPARWNYDGFLQADHLPDPRHMSGIHCTKRMGHPELGNYINRSYRYYPETYESAIVKCALSGRVIETEQGFRAYQAQIIGVYRGNWQSYQDYRERSRTRSHYNSIEEEIQWRYIGRWGNNPTPIAYYDPQA